METYYHVEINWSKDRKGLMCSPEIDGNFFGEHGCIEVATPPEFPKGMAGIWSPEHLFTASVSSCLMTTFLAVAENSKLEFTHFNCKSKGKLETIEGKYLMTEVHLEPEVTIAHRRDYEKALRVIKKSEAACLISNSIKSIVMVTPYVKISDHISYPQIN